MPHCVLVVDDDDAHRRTVERALHGTCAVLGVSGGDAALQVLERESVSLLLTDQRMPGMSGVELLARAAEHHPRVVRLLLTAFADIETLGEAINAGHVYAFLSKPWQPVELRLTVRRGLDWSDARTEREHLVRRLREACAAAEREAEGATRLLALLAHELGTPAHIALNASALLGEMELPPAARRWVEALQRAAQWLARGVAQVHRAGGGERRALVLRRRPLDLRAVVADVVASVRVAAAERTLRFACVCDDGAAPACNADPTLLREAIWNLLSNAVRNTPDGGAIEARVRCGDERVVVSVRDNGVGIAAEDLAHVFEPFANGADIQLHGSGWLAFGARGLGLGLALTRRIAAAHGGDVTVDSTPGAGACFSLELPQRAGA